MQSFNSAGFDSLWFQQHNFEQLRITALEAARNLRNAIQMKAIGLALVLLLGVTNADGVSGPADSLVPSINDTASSVIVPQPIIVVPPTPPVAILGSTQPPLATAPTSASLPNQGQVTELGASSTSVLIVTPMPTVPPTNTPQSSALAPSSSGTLPASTPVTVTPLPIVNPSPTAPTPPAATTNPIVNSPQAPLSAPSSPSSTTSILNPTNAPWNGYGQRPQFHQEYRPHQYQSYQPYQPYHAMQNFAYQPSFMNAPGSGAFPAPPVPITTSGSPQVSTTQAPQVAPLNAWGPIAPSSNFQIPLSQDPRNAQFTGRPARPARMPKRKANKARSQKARPLDIDRSGWQIPRNPQ